MWREPGSKQTATLIGYSEVLQAGKLRPSAIVFVGSQRLDLPLTGGCRKFFDRVRPALGSRLAICFMGRDDAGRPRFRLEVAP